MSIPAAEFAKARRWRESLGLDQKAFGEQVGYSRMSVYWFEEGKTPPVRHKPRRSRQIDPWVWHRYKLACAGLAAEIANGRKFNWQE